MITIPKERITFQAMESVASAFYALVMLAEYGWVASAGYRVSWQLYAMLLVYLLFAIFHRVRPRWCVLVLTVYHGVVNWGFLSGLICSCPISFGIWAYTTLLIFFSGRVLIEWFFPAR